LVKFERTVQSTFAAVAYSYLKLSRVRVLTFFESEANALVATVVAMRAAKRNFFLTVVLVFLLNSFLVMSFVFH
jgi:hypothetical protein